MAVYFSPEQEARPHQNGRTRPSQCSEELRAAIDQGAADIEAGHYTDYTEDTLHQLFSDVRRRGREALGSGLSCPDDGTVAAVAASRERLGRDLALWR